MNKQKLVTTLFILAFSLTGLVLNAQSWMWKKGSNNLDQPGTYGTINVPAASNNPGAREYPMRWKDASGNLWMFGGSGFDGSSTSGLLNDLWKYDPASNQWTWIKGDNAADQMGVYGTLGVGAAANKPGGRVDGVAWADNSGNLWLFGGYGWDGSSIGPGFLNDLWKYNITSNQWTWMGGNNVVDQNGVYGTVTVPSSTVMPGGRVATTGWKDNSGNFWLFAGVGFDFSSPFPSLLNDVWRYNPTTNQWTWMTGSNTSDQPGTYGTINTPNPANIPGARYDATGVTDASGNIWLYGGYGYDNSAFSNGDLNDLWRYSPTTNQWAWVSGANIVDQNGVYGTINVPAASNQPGSRNGATMWADGTGNLWLFGGIGYDATSVISDQLNDLWRYNITANQWTWVKGSNTQAQTGVYGTQGVSAPANTPGARGAVASWIDASNNLWLFGGSGYNNTAWGYFNDLWKTCTAANLTVSAQPAAVCAGANSTITVSGSSTYTWSTSQQTNAIVVNTTSTTNYSVISTDASGCGNSAVVTLSVNPGPTVTIAPSSPSICIGSSATLTASGAVMYAWSTTVVATSITVSPTSTTIYSVVGASANTCTNMATYTLTVNPNPTVAINSTKAEICAGESATLSTSSASSYSWSTASSNTNSFVVVKPANTSTYMVTITDAKGCKNSSSFTQSVSACTGINDNSPLLLSLAIYPNPSKGNFNIKYEGSLDKSALIIYNASGQMVYESALSGSEVRVEANLAKGLYYCKIVSEGKTQASSKLLVE